MPAGGRITISGGNVTLPKDNSVGLPGGDYVRICFSDEGCGIAEDEQGKIFDPYFTTKAGGTGLGLASTYSIIKKHNGRITVSSTSGIGTTFTIFLPSLSEPICEQAAAEPGATEIHGTGAILVMDDDEMVRELAGITLKRFGYVVTTCQSGTEAIDLYRSARDGESPFTMVIMDLTIPGGMGGVEAARQILAFDPAAHLIVSSGYSEDPVMAHYAEYGFCASIEKPYKVEDIIAILQRVNAGSAGAD
jgi:CheY-like chemotaxis protein